MDLSLAASEDYAAALAPVRRTALSGAGLGLLATLAGAALLLRIAARETRGIGLVARRASAVAAGDLDQRIEVSHSGETRELAENFNTMAERLRELIAREAESRQFQSFMRISAMVTHDLKNAIAGLSMLVSNMERYFDREEFRADAIESLREATEKLKRTAARLSEPALSLSGEYRLAARPTDLVPIIRRVLATNAEPTRPLYDIEARLPEKLVATVEPERVENVVENLVINALEAMGAKGGRLTVEAGRLDGDLVFFSVADTGVGMTRGVHQDAALPPLLDDEEQGHRPRALHLPRDGRGARRAPGGRVEPRRWHALPRRATIPPVPFGRAAREAGEGDGLHRLKRWSNSSRCPFQLFQT